jgi:hypothetical protein
MAKARLATGLALAAIEIAPAFDATKRLAVHLGRRAVVWHEALDATPEHAEGRVLV